MHPLSDLDMVNSKIDDASICHPVSYFLGSCSLASIFISCADDVDIYNTSVLLVSMLYLHCVG
jgi:hypothetical protein